MAEILVVDDELGIRNVLSEVLADAGFVFKIIFPEGKAE